MGIAQELYTGIDLGEGPVGLITYMRTDSINLAQEATVEIRQIIPKYTVMMRFQRKQESTQTHQKMRKKLMKL